VIGSDICGTIPTAGDEQASNNRFWSLKITPPALTFSLAILIFDFWS
jgi:hypothetical protein